VADLHLLRLDRKRSSGLEEATRTDGTRFETCRPTRAPRIPLCRSLKTFLCSAPFRQIRKRRISGDPLGGGSGANCREPRPHGSRSIRDQLLTGKPMLPFNKGREAYHRESTIEPGAPLRPSS
jgi:hypothetical protein